MASARRTRLPFWLRRPVLLVKGIRVDRDRPAFDELASETDPERFVWAILAHVARSFAPSVLMLPSAHALTAAVAYLYCRMLDTYEDISDPAERIDALRAFSGRMSTLAEPPGPPPPPDRRSQAHALLIERCALIDSLLVSLDDRDKIVRLVTDMADGMQRSADWFREQGGVLENPDQVSRYCHSVIGLPVLFVLDLMIGDELTPEARVRALEASEFIQLANITRDIESDLVLGVAYHPGLRSHLGGAGDRAAVGEARRDLLVLALSRAASYTRLAADFDAGRFSLARGSSMMMLLFTSDHYRRQLQMIGHPGWAGPSSRVAIVVASLRAVVSRRWSADTMSRMADHLASVGVALGQAA